MKNYKKNYLEKIYQNLNELNEKELFKFIKLIRIVKEKNSKIIFVGNGGSAAMASHVSVDFTKACKIRSVNFNEADLLTCYANDFGYENWVKEALKSYALKDDLIVLFSSSGKSKNMINAAKYCKQKKLKLVTFTGFSFSNPLGKMGNLNFWVNSKNYNFVEMTHHIWVLMAVDYLTK
tara:strand:+ start:194 stop:727 length:534 start_codon:yes stop_codon:yes gene_type:complete